MPRKTWIAAALGAAMFLGGCVVYDPYDGYGGRHYRDGRGYYGERYDRRDYRDYRDNRGCWRDDGREGRDDRRGRD